MVYFIAQGPMESFFNGISPDGRPPPGGGRPYFLFLRVATCLIPIVVIAFDQRRARELVRASWPFWLQVALSVLFLSVAQNLIWSGARLTLSFLSIIPAFAICLRLPSRQLVRCIVYTLVISMVLSIAVGFILPAYGITGNVDTYGDFNEAGTWRGIFSGKNVFGHLAGIAVAVVLVSGRQVLGSRILQVLALIVSLICVALSRSASGVVIAVAVPAVYYAIVKPRGLLRVVALFAAAIGTVGALLLQSYVVDTVLTALGKNDTLTGRTNIWHVAEEFMWKYPLTGAGYNYTGSPEMAGILKSLFSVYSVHNAYLDAVICLGWIGTAVLGLSIIVALWSAWRAPVAPQVENLRDLATVVMIGCMVSSLSEANVAQPNGLLNLIAVTALFALYKVGETRKRLA